MDQELQDALNEAVAQQLRADSAEKERDGEKSRADKLAGELAGLQTQHDALRKERADVDVDKMKRQITALSSQLSAEKKARLDAESPDRVRALVKARVDLERKASAVLEGARFDEMSDRDIKVAVIERLDGKVDPANSDGFVDGQFSTLIKGHAQGAAAIARVREITEARADEKVRTDGRSAREKFLEKQANAAFQESK